MSLCNRCQQPLRLDQPTRRTYSGAHRYEHARAEDCIRAPSTSRQAAARADVPGREDPDG